MFERRPNIPEKIPEEESLAAEALAHLPVVKAPDAIWHALEASLDMRAPLEQRRWWPQWALAAAIALVLIGVGFRTLRPSRWVVVGRNGTATIGPGEWIQTDKSSRAELRVGNIGKVEVEPGTRLRIVSTRRNEHRLALERGEIAATILASPRLFVVETASATAFDLGCEYRMKMDEAGNGLLRVTRGWVSFEWQGREMLVPAGALCRTRAGLGPGTPVFEDAPKSLAAALDDFDFARGGEQALRAVLAQARPRDTLTLWHLLALTAPPLRSLVYDRMTAFAPPPTGVSRDRALALDPRALKIWKDELAWTW